MSRPSIEAASRAPRKSGDSTGRSAFGSWLDASNTITQLVMSGAHADMINLSGGLPAPEIYPIAEIAKLAGQVVAERGARALGYCPIEGLPELRAEIARRLSTTRLRLDADNVLITAGSMQGLDLLGKILIEPGETIVAHYPTYLGALDAWRPRNPRYSELALEALGGDELPEFSGAKFVYLIPNFSNPTGALVGPEMRQALLARANEASTWLVEDDPYGALYYDAPPLPSILELSAGPSAAERYDGPVVYLGTMSKTFVPGLRIGWIVAEPEIIKALTIAKQGSDICTGAFQQFVALEAFQRGIVDHLAGRILDLYRMRRDALCEAVHEYLDADFHWQKPSGGMFVWLTANDPSMNTDVLLKEALSGGVSFNPSSVFDSAERKKNALRINFTFNAPELLREGMARLSRAVDKLKRAGAKGAAV